MSVTRFLRTSPDGTTDYLPGVPLDTEPVENWTGTGLPKIPAGFDHGYQTIAFKIANQVTTGYYPDDGSGQLALQATAGASQAMLPSGALQTFNSTLTPVGLLMACRYATSPDLWEVTRITAVSGQTVTFNRTITNTWAQNSKFHLLYDVRFAEYLQIMSEFSGSVVTAEADAVWFAWPDSGKLVRAWDEGSFTIANSGVLGTAGEIQETGYYHGRGTSRIARGFMGVKLRVASVSGGTASFWLGRV